MQMPKNQHFHPPLSQSIGRGVKSSRQKRNDYCKAFVYLLKGRLGVFVMLRVRLMLPTCSPLIPYDSLWFSFHSKIHEMVHIILIHPPAVFKSGGFPMLKRICCGWCEMLFFACRSCWRGQAYRCPECRILAKRLQRRRAQRKYRSTEKGRRTRRQAERRHRLRRNGHGADGPGSVSEKNPALARGRGFSAEKSRRHLNRFLAFAKKRRAPFERDVLFGSRRGLSPTGAQGPPDLHSGTCPIHVRKRHRARSGPEKNGGKAASRNLRKLDVAPPRSRRCWTATAGPDRSRLPNRREGDGRK